MEVSRAIVVRCGSHYGLALVGPRGGARFVRMRSKRLTVERIGYKDLLKGWVETDLDPKDAALTFMRHAAGCTEGCDKLLNQIIRG